VAYAVNAANATDYKNAKVKAVFGLSNADSISIPKRLKFWSFHKNEVWHNTCLHFQAG